MLQKSVKLHSILYYEHVLGYVKKNEFWWASWKLVIIQNYAIFSGLSNHAFWKLTYKEMFIPE